MGRRLRQVRQARGLSQIDVGRAVGTTRAAVSQWELGKAIPTNANLVAAAQKLGPDVTADWLRTGRGRKPDLTKKVSGWVPEMEGGIGAAGPYSEAKGIIEWWWFPPPVLENCYQTTAENLRIYRVHSDSMEPTIRLGSYVLINIARRMIEDHGIYAIDNGFSVVLKRLSVLPGERVRARADAEAREDGEIYPASRIIVVGRCVGRIDRL